VALRPALPWDAILLIAITLPSTSGQMQFLVAALNTEVGVYDGRTSSRRRGDSVITRRSVLLAGGSGLFLAHRVCLGQPQSKTPRIGVLWVNSISNPMLLQYRSVFIQRLAALGYVEGQNFLIEERSAEGHAERLGELARELVASKVDVIVAPTVGASSAARQATGTIPIVMLHAGDPVGAGLIASLARPGGNVTGTTNLSLGGKQVELIRELVPRTVKLAVLVNPSNAGTRNYVADAMETGRSFNLSVTVAEVARVEDFPNAFAMIRNTRPDGLLVMDDLLIGGQRAQVIAFAASNRLPAIYGNASIVRDGGLVSYGPRLAEHYVMAAGYVDRILKGAKPADLPVEQPTRFEHVINLKTAKALGITIPQALVVRADEKIE
jgi:putative ABC transport system substrate-binding protein